MRRTDSSSVAPVRSVSLCPGGRLPGPNVQVGRAEFPSPLCATPPFLLIAMDLCWPRQGEVDADGPHHFSASLPANVNFDWAARCSVDSCIERT